jgi:hypothetical protein
MRFNVLLEVTTMSAAFWDVTPCSFIEAYTRLGGHTASIFRVKE